MRVKVCGMTEIEQFVEALSQYGILLVSDHPSESAGTGEGA